MIPTEWLNHAPKPKDLGKTELWNVFLSYRSVNRTWVLNLYDILSELGYKVFIDQCELKAGEELIYRLNEALGKSQSGILIWSDAAADSAWVYKEYERLETKSTKNPDFNFVPIKLDRAELPEFADSRIFIDFSSYPDGPNGGELIRLVHGIVGKKMDAATVKFADEQEQASVSASEELDAAVRNGYPEDIIALSDSDTLPWKTTPSLACKAAENLTKLGKYDEAINILEKTEERFKMAVRPKQLHALALARKGSPDFLKQAQRILAKLYEQGERDPETLGIYARTWMDRYQQSGEIKDLRQSRDYYAEAFQRTDDDYYTGINAAAKSVFLGELDEAAGFAAQVEQIVGSKEVPNNYWKTATIAEVMLIQKKYDQAAYMYGKAISYEKNSKGNHESTWKQAKLLMEKLRPAPKERTLIAGAFQGYLQTGL